MIIGRRGWRLAAVTLGVATLTACEPTEGARVAKSTLVLGIDVSGSFSQHYDDAIRFASHYLYGHIHGMGGLRPPTAVFVGSVGGAKPGQSKSFQPITAFEDKTPEDALVVSPRSCRKSANSTVVRTSGCSSSELSKSSRGRS